MEKLLKNTDLDIVEDIGFAERFSGFLKSSSNELNLPEPPSADGRSGLFRRFGTELLDHPRRYIVAGAVALGGLGAVTRVAIDSRKH